LIWAVVATAFLAGCSTEQPTFSSIVTPAPPNRIDLARLAPGPILITSRPDQASIEADPPSARIESAGEGAASAARKVMDTPDLGHPQLEAVVGVFGFVAAPFAAAYGAVSASRERLSAGQMAAAEQDLAQAMRTNADSAILREKVAELARQKTHRLLVSAASASVLAQNRQVSAVLEVAVERLRLKADGNQYTLSIAARARLVRSSDAAVLLDRPYEYQSGSDMFIDWARPGGLEGVARTGYRAIAEQIAADVFQPISAPPILIGPGQQHSSFTAPGRAAHRRTGARAGQAGMRRASAPVFCSASLNELPSHVRSVRAGLRQITGRPVRRSDPWEGVSFQFVSLQQEDTPTMEIHTTGTNRLSLVQKPGTASEASGENGTPTTETEQAMDGLVNDRNSVVQGLSCLAAVPLGLWEQTVGALRKGPRERTEKLAMVLNEVAAQKHFERDLANELARCLHAAGVSLVQRADELTGLTVSSAVAGEAGGAAATAPGTQGKPKTAMEIQVLNIELVGKHLNSKSRAVAMEMRITITRNSDGQEIYTCPIRYRGSPRKLKEWAASDARLFREELDRCSRETARALATELLARGLVSRKRNPGTAVPGQL